MENSVLDKTQIEITGVNGVNGNKNNMREKDNV